MDQHSFLSFTETLRIFQISFGVVILFCVAELTRRRFYLSSEFTRKFIHLAVGVFIFFAPQIFERKTPILVLSALFIIVDMLAYRRRWIAAVHGTARNSFGTVFYPLSLFLLTFLLWDRSPVFVVASMMPMVFGDAIAGITGELLPKPHTYRLTSDTKSIEGSVAMFVGSVLALSGTAFYYHQTKLDQIIFSSEPLWLLLVVFASISLFATCWEAISSRGLDNVTIPLATAFALYYCFYPEAHGERSLFLLATGISLLLAIVSYRFRLLNLSGASAMFLLAVIIFSGGSWRWALPILSFFILSSALSKVNSTAKRLAKNVTEKGSERDWLQVLANGGIAGGIVLIYLLDRNPIWYAVFTGAVAASTSDTWSTEIGMLSGKQPIDLITFHHEQAGTSGAVTLIGLLGGIFGALVIGVISFFFSTGFAFATWIAVIVLSGFAGCLIDSLVGATLQARFECVVCHKQTEQRHHCQTATQLVRGFRWLDNDAVNIICSFTGATIAALFMI